MSNVIMTSLEAAAGTKSVRTRKDGGVEAVVNLGGFFYDSEDDERIPVDGDKVADSGSISTDTAVAGNRFQEIYEVQRLELSGEIFQVRQFSWHCANANKVWPGTFVLSEYIDSRIDFFRSGRVLELGAATGALSMFLARRGVQVVTSDIDDGGDVEANIKYNFELNGISVVPHVSHTWGSHWTSELYPATLFSCIVASDILLYVSAYPHLVQTLSELFSGGGVTEFVMSWNRRIAESSIFFDLMKTEGFSVTHHGQCVYSFSR